MRESVFPEPPLGHLTCTRTPQSSPHLVVTQPQQTGESPLISLTSNAALGEAALVRKIWDPRLFSELFFP